MSGILRRKLGLELNNEGFAVIKSITQLGPVQNQNCMLAAVLRLFSASSSGTKAAEHEPKSGSDSLSRESGLSVSDRLRFETPEEQNAVRLLRDYGFDDAHISKLVGKNPSLMSAKTEIVLGLLLEYEFTPAQISQLASKFPRFLLLTPKSIQPKLEFMLSIGVSRSNLGTVICKNPLLLERSLEHTIIPCYNALTSILLCNEKVVTAFTRLSWFRISYLLKDLPLNVSVLTGLGVPHSKISYLVKGYPSVVSCDPEKFSQLVKKVIEFGIDPLQQKFVPALIAVFGRWDHKMDAFRTWGISEDEVLSAFKRYPLFMTLSEKKLTSTMDFLVNTMGVKPAEVIRVPCVLSHSLAMRIVPRCSVLRVLLLKGLVKKKISLSYTLMMPERCFIESYVIKYEKEMPQLLNILRGEMSIDELGCVFEEKPWTTNV
uniref:Transcription termination factor MTERF15-like n=1 Tax=Rhizophora mucronata TaxID=61149 RepID=A0A2P2QCB5_RHIMU